MTHQKIGKNLFRYQVDRAGDRYRATVECVNFRQWTPVSDTYATRPAARRAIKAWLADRSLWTATA